jgi:FHA domain-containing protein
MQGQRLSNSIQSSPSSDSQDLACNSSSRFIQTLIEQLHPEPQLREQLLSMGRERDPQLFFEGLLNLGMRFEKQDQLQEAVAIYETIIAHSSERDGETRGGGEGVTGRQGDKGIIGLAQSPGHQVPQSIALRAQARLDAIRGVGSSAARLEYLANRFFKDAIDYKTIVPMLGSTALFSLVRTAAAAKLAASGAGIISQGLGLKFASALIGSAVEIPAFALSGRALHQLAGDQVRESVSDDLLSSGITLTLLKGFGFAGNKAFQHVHQVNELGLATRLAGLSKFTQPLLSQSFMFAGLLTGHKAEEKAGLRAHVDNATTVTDTLASMVSLGVGGHLGHQVLGSGYAKFQQEMEFRSQNAESNIEHRTSDIDAKNKVDVLSSMFNVQKRPALASIAAIGAGLATFFGVDLAHAAVRVAEAGSEGGTSSLLSGLAPLALGVLGMAASKRGKEGLQKLTKAQEKDLRSIYQKHPDLEISLAGHGSKTQKYQLLTLLAEKVGETYRNLPRALNGLRGTNWTFEQKSQLLTLLAEKEGENAWRAYVRLPKTLRGLRGAGWTSKQKYQLLTLLAEKACGMVEYAYEYLPQAVEELRGADWSSKQKYQLLTLLAEKVDDLVGFFYQYLPQALEGLRGTDWTSEQKYQCLTLLAEKAGRDMVPSFALLRTILLITPGPKQWAMARGLLRLHDYLSDYNRMRVVQLLKDSQVIFNGLGPGYFPEHFELYVQFFERWPRLGYNLLEGFLEATQKGLAPKDLSAHREKILHFIGETNGFVPALYEAYLKEGEALFPKLKVQVDAILKDQFGMEAAQRVIKENGEEYLLGLIQMTSPTSGASFVNKEEQLGLMRKMLEAGDRRGDIPVKWQAIVKDFLISQGDWKLKVGEVGDPEGKIKSLLDQFRISEKEEKIEEKTLVEALAEYLQSGRNEGARSQLQKVLYEFAGQYDALKEKIDRIQDKDYTALILLEQLFGDKDNLQQILAGALEQVPAELLAAKAAKRKIEGAANRLVKSIKKVWAEQIGGQDIPLEKRIEILGSILKGYETEDIEEKILNRPDVSESLKVVIRQTMDLVPTLSKKQIIAEILAEPIELIQKEKSKFAYQDQGTLKVGLRAVKGPAYGLNGLSSGVCTATDMELWKNPSFKLLAITDESKGQVVGYIHVFETQIDGKKYLTLPGINPSAEFLGTVDAKKLYTGLMEKVIDFAQAGDYAGIYIPTDPIIHSNRSDIQKAIKHAKYPLKNIPEVKWNTLPNPYPFTEVYKVWERPVAQGPKGLPPLGGTGALATIAAVGAGLATFLGADLAHAAIQGGTALSEGGSMGLLKALGIASVGVLGMAVREIKRTPEQEAAFQEAMKQAELFMDQLPKGSEPDQRILYRHLEKTLPSLLVEDLWMLAQKFQEFYCSNEELPWLGLSLLEDIKDEIDNRLKPAEVLGRALHFVDAMGLTPYFKWTMSWESWEEFDESVIPLLDSAERLLFVDKVLERLTSPYPGTRWAAFLALGYVIPTFHLGDRLELLGQTLAKKDLRNIPPEFFSILLKNIPLKTLHQHAEQHPSDELRALVAYQEAGLPWDPYFFGPYLDASDRERFIQELTPLIEEHRRGKVLTSFEDKELHLAYAGLDSPDKLPFVEFRMNRKIPPPRFLENTFKASVSEVHSLHHRVDKGKILQALAPFKAVKSADSFRQYFEDLFAREKGGLRSVKADLQAVFPHGFSGLGLEEILEGTQKLLPRIYSHRKIPAVQNLIVHLSLLLARHRKGIDHLKQKMGLIDEKKISSDNVWEGLKATEEFYRDTVEDALKELKLKGEEISIFKKQRRILAAELERARQKGDKMIEVEFIPSKSQADFFYGYVGEDCNKEWEGALKNSIYEENFQIYRMISKGRLTGMIYLQQGEVDGKKVLLMAIQPRSFWEVDSKALLQAIEENFGRIAHESGYDFVFLMDEAGMQSNRQDMLKAIKERNYPLKKFEKGSYLYTVGPFDDDMTPGDEFRVMWERPTDQGPKGLPPLSGAGTLATIAAVGAGLATLFGTDLAHAAVQGGTALSEDGTMGLLKALGIAGIGVLGMAAGKRAKKKLSPQQIKITEVKEPGTPLMPEYNREIERVVPSQKSASSYTSFIDPKKSLRIGRAPDNDIIISHPEVGDYHAEIDFSHYPNILVRDLNSDNGTFLRGARLDPKDPGNLRGKHLKAYLKDINIGPVRIDVDLPANITDFSQVVLVKTIDSRGERWAIKDYSTLKPAQPHKKKK